MNSASQRTSSSQNEGRSRRKTRYPGTRVVPGRSHRAPPWAFTHHTHRQHLQKHVLSSPEGSASSRWPHTARPEGPRRATHASDPRSNPPLHTSQHTWYGRGTAPFQVVSVLLKLCTISAAAPVEGGRVDNQWAAAALLPSDKIVVRPTRHPCDYPNPKRQLAADAAALPLRTMHACARSVPRRLPIPARERAGRGTHAPPHWAPPAAGH